MIATINRRTIRSRISDILTNARVCRAWLFGSYARNQENENSDIDIIVEFSKGRHYSLLDLAELEMELQSRLGITIHLLTRSEINKRIRPSVDREKKLIYEQATG